MNQIIIAKALVKSLRSLCSKLKLPAHWGRQINNVMSTHNGFYINTTSDLPGIPFIKPLQVF